MHRWHVIRDTPAGPRPIEGQPEEGFAGPGVAFQWLINNGVLTPGRDRHGLRVYPGLGTELFLVRSDGARPKVNTKRERTHHAGIQAAAAIGRTG